MKHTLKFKESIDISAGRLNTWAGFNSFTKQITPQGLAVWPFDFKSPNLGHGWLRLRLAIALQSLWNTGSPCMSRCRTTTLVKVQQTGPQSLDVSRRFFSLTQQLIASRLHFVGIEIQYAVCRFDIADLGRCLSEYETWSTGKEKIRTSNIIDLPFSCRFTTGYRAQLDTGHKYLATWRTISWSLSLLTEGKNNHEKSVRTHTDLTN